MLSSERYIRGRHNAAFRQCENDLVVQLWISHMLRDRRRHPAPSAILRESNPAARGTSISLVAGIARALGCAQRRHDHQARNVVNSVNSTMRNTGCSGVMSIG
jgi:hypothetical protein